MEGLFGFNKKQKRQLYDQGIKHKIKTNSLL